MSTGRRSDSAPSSSRRKPGWLGIAVEADATIVLDRQEVIRAADRAGSVRGRRSPIVSASRPPFIFLVAGEPSGDALGGALIAALRQRTGGRSPDRRDRRRAHAGAGSHQPRPAQRHRRGGCRRSPAAGAGYPASGARDRSGDPSAPARRRRDDRQLGVQLADRAPPAP